MDAVREEKSSLEEVLYYIMFSLLLCLKGVGLEESSSMFRGVLAAAIILFVAKILIGKYSLRELIVLSVGVFGGVFYFWHIGSLSILIYALILLGMKNVSVPKVMKMGAVVWSACFIATVTAAIFFNRTGVQLVHEKLGLGPVLRESLGYSHPNVLHVTYIVLMAFILYTCEKKYVMKTIVLLLLGDIWVFLYSMSYTGLLISFGMLVVYLYFTYRKQILIGEKIAIASILPLCIIVSIIPVVLDAHGRIYQIMNSALNNRVWAIKVFFNDYPQTILGQRIIRDNFSLDNSYIYALAWYGIAFLLVMAALYEVLVIKYLRTNRRKELAIILSFLVAGITEQFLFNASIKNITFVFLGEVIFEFLKQEENEVSLLSRLNHTLRIPMEWKTDWMQKLKSTAKQRSWKGVIIQYIIINSIVLSGLFFIKTNPFKQVYANEGMCDCGGILVSGDQINETDDTLVLGSKSKEDQFYYFTDENSNFIKVMDGRYKISLSIYITAAVMLGERLLEFVKGVIMRKDDKNRGKDDICVGERK